MSFVDKELIPSIFNELRIGIVILYSQYAFGYFIDIQISTKFVLHMKLVFFIAIAEKKTQLSIFNLSYWMWKNKDLANCNSIQTMSLGDVDI